MKRVECLIRHSSFVIRHSSFVIRHSSFVIRHSSFVIRHSVVILHVALASFLAAPLSAQQECSDGAYYLARGDFPRALRSLSMVRDETNSTASALNLRGIAELMNGNESAALAFFDKALEADTAYGIARFNRGIALLHLKRNDDAAKEFARIWTDESSPYRARAAYHHALADDAAERLPSAATWLEKAIAHDPDLAEAYLYLGVIREKQGDFDAAGRAYRDYLGHQPESIVAMLRFGVVAYRARYGDTARKYLREVVARAPQSAEAAEARKFLIMWE